VDRLANARLRNPTSIPPQGWQKLKVFGKSAQCMSTSFTDSPGIRPAAGVAPSRPSPVFLIGRAVLRPLLRLRFRPRVSGLDNIPGAGAVLLASNHLASLDTILIPSLSTRQVRFLAKASLFRTPLRGWFMRRIGSVPVMREAGSAANAALEAGRRVLAAGEVFAVFPEGSRSRDGRLYRGRSGAAFMALETGACVIPVGLVGTNRKMKDPATGRAPRVEVRFGCPVPLDDLAGLPAGRARREATARIMEAIRALSGQELADGFAEVRAGA